MRDTVRMRVRWGTAAYVAVSVACVAGRRVADVPSMLGVPLASRFGRWEEAVSVAAGDPNCPYQPILPSQLPTPLPPGIASAIAVINQTMASTISSAVPGGAVSVSYMGTRLFASGYGTANLSDGTPATPDTPFRVASVSKMFAALLLYALDTAGKVRLDDAVSSYAPGFGAVDLFEGSDGKSITFRHLADQMSGLQRETPLPWYNVTTEEMLTAVAGTLLLFPVGSTPSYSNLAFAILGHVLGEYVVPGTDYPTLVSQYVLEPLGLRNTGFNYTPAVMAQLAPGYVDGQPVPFADLGWWYPAGSMYSTVADLDVVAQALIQAANTLSTPLPISHAHVRTMLGPAYLNPDLLSGFGTPWELRTTSNYTIRAKGGNLPGYAALFSAVPELGLSIQATWNGMVDEFGFCDTVWPAIIPVVQDVLASLQPAAPTGPSPNDYVGTYTLPSGGPNATVQMYQGQLVFTVAGTGVFMWYRATDAFQAYIPSGLVPCFNNELQALQGEFIYFTRDPNNLVATVSMLGWEPGVLWYKVQG